MFKDLRVSAGLTQEEMAKRLNISRSTIAMWETGESFPRTDKLKEIAQLLHCTLDDLLDRKPEAKQ